MSLNSLDRTPQLPIRIVEAIRREIGEGRLKPGDRLPGEQMLADTFKVSRNVVREAIARLRSDGVVQSRQGIGAFVVRNTPLPILRVEPDAANNRAAFTHVFELRTMLEVRAASLAALRGTEAQHAAISEALMKMRGIEKWADKGVDADLEFHRAVALATGNDYVARVVGFVSEHMRDSILETRRRPNANLKDIVDITITEHEAIHDAIVARDAALARATMELHIINAAQRVGVSLQTGL
ncbi:FadR/GntR family transcriptional regulator [Lichenihabitans sp. Uapishka_5]|uniref:FadR/GntR family transcriptional regulator n=1 Tax=Lichenihabitans sp. Uapishka_5 TaxID=3037302 RepID=UPI0029E81C9E|nr:FadR/GntR family transcriptional regulator [Lichenihabitans sp. Uapishka_5]MDX7950829.1 FadR/GntR family transcriptional regulator [Lichenihabitans sp. Uapishka_5]